MMLHVGDKVRLLGQRDKRPWVIQGFIKPLFADAGGVLIVLHRDKESKYVEMGRPTLLKIIKETP